MAPSTHPEVPQQQQMATGGGGGGGGADMGSCPALRDENNVSGNWYGLKSCFNR